VEILVRAVVVISLFLMTIFHSEHELKIVCV